MELKIFVVLGLSLAPPPPAHGCSVSVAMSAVGCSPCPARAFAPLPTAVGIDSPHSVPEWLGSAPLLEGAVGFDCLEHAGRACWDEE